MPDIFRRSGVVRAPDGRPIAGAYITIAEASVRVPEIAIMTDDDGCFVLGLPEGVFTLRAHTDEGVADLEIINPDDADIGIVVPGEQGGTDPEDQADLH